MRIPVAPRPKWAALLSAPSAPSALVLPAGAPAALAETRTAAQPAPVGEEALGLESILELDVTDLPGTREGQPVVAVDPRNPRNLVCVATVFPDRPALEPVGECFVAFSQDRGKTWQRSTWPLGDLPCVW